MNVLLLLGLDHSLSPRATGTSGEARSRHFWGGAKSRHLWGGAKSRHLWGGASRQPTYTEALRRAIDE